MAAFDKIILRDKLVAAGWKPAGDEGYELEPPAVMFRFPTRRFYVYDAAKLHELLWEIAEDAEGDTIYLPVKTEPAKTIRIFATDTKTSDRREITDLYWFEENGIRDWSGDSSRWGSNYMLEVFADGALVYRTPKNQQDEEPTHAH